MEELMGSATTAVHAYAASGIVYPMWAMNPMMQMGNQHAKSVKAMANSFLATIMSRWSRRLACSPTRPAFLEFVQMTRLVASWPAAMIKKRTEFTPKKIATP